ncbi:hypothetical protein NPX79_01550 [Spiroplasma endosymbiont of Anurida maritima]|uniref:hypothetical protein n=1 Tax=Spiroplasma endosymbiont of Anurida maritima TaxID=2967972 RepID=UPI0036D304B6
MIDSNENNRDLNNINCEECINNEYECKCEFIEGTFFCCDITDINYDGSCCHQVNNYFVEEKNDNVLEKKDYNVKKLDVIDLENQRLVLMKEIEILNKIKLSTLTAIRNIKKEINNFYQENNEINNNFKTLDSKAKDIADNLEKIRKEVTRDFSNNNLVSDNEINSIKVEKQTTYNDQDEINSIKKESINTDYADSNYKNLEENKEDYQDDYVPLKRSNIIKAVPVEEDIMDTVPAKSTYNNYKIYSKKGTFYASEIYNDLFDMYGAQKLGQFEIMDKYGLNKKQYKKVYNNFYGNKK